jgi:hypothetical protein
MMCSQARSQLLIAVSDAFMKTTPCWCRCRIVAWFISLISTLSRSESFFFPTSSQCPLPEELALLEL